MSDESMIERVGRAINEAMCPVEGYAGTPTECLARAAIEAMREPTDGMIEASWSAELEGLGWPEEARSVWTAMIGHTLT